MKVAGLSAAGAAVGGTGFVALSAAAKERLAAKDNRTVYSACVMCPAECAIAINVENGVASSIYGNPYAPLNSGVLCAKGAAGLQMVYNANRIKYPMIRVGERGENKFKRVSWDEALDYMADRLLEYKEKYGPESVIMDCGDVTDRDPYYYMFRAFGTPHTVEHGSICDTPRRHGPKWNPYTNPDYAKYKDEYPFQVISGRIHHAMSGTQMVDWLGRIPTEDLWVPLNDERVVDEVVIGENGPEPTGRKVRIQKGTWSIGVIQMNRVDGEKLGLETGDLVELETPLDSVTLFL